jgi:diacylglycerol kinase family enzyme
MDVVLLHNESAGYEDWSRPQLLRCLRRAGLRPKYYALDAALAKPRVLETGEWIVVAGGDGSVRKIALQLIGSGKPLVVLPLGTANNIARSLGLLASSER